MNNLLEEIIVKILQKIPKNEIQDFRLISRHFNASIKAGFGTTLSINASRQDFPESLWEGHVTTLKLKDYSSSNPQDLPPLPRLKVLKIGGVMRLQTLVRILRESPNLQDVSIKFPKILDMDFDGTMALDGLPVRIETLEIEFEKRDIDTDIKLEASLLQILSQLPLTSLKLFSCLYVNGVNPMVVPNNLSTLMRTILTKCRRTLMGLVLSRPYDWPEDPKSPLIEEELKLKLLGLFWVGESRWLRSLIESQRAWSGLETLSIFCYEDLWVDGVVQEVTLASKATLKIFGVDLHLKVGQIINEELNLGFLTQLSKLEDFFIKSERDFILNQGRRVLEEPLDPLILPRTLKKAALNAPITFQTLQSFCALPALEELTLEGFKWVDYPTLLAFVSDSGEGNEVVPTPSVLLDWNWFKNLLINCPSLKSIKFFGCIVDILGMIS